MSNKLPAANLAQAIANGSPATPATVAPSRRMIHNSPAGVKRVWVLMAAIAMMSVADLGCTLTYMRTCGMSEANPLARFVVLEGGVGNLIIFKLSLTLLTCLCLFGARKDKRGEACSWMCAIIMLGLSIHWHVYNSHVERYSPELVAVVLGPERPHDWVMIPN